MTLVLFPSRAWPCSGFSHALTLAGQLVAIIVGARHLTEPINSSRLSACRAQPRPSFSSPRDGILTGSRLKSHASPQSRVRSQTTSGSSRLWAQRMTPHPPLYQSHSSSYSSFHLFLKSIAHPQPQWHLLCLVPTRFVSIFPTQSQPRRPNASSA